MFLIYESSDVSVYIEKCGDKKKQSECALGLLYDVLYENNLLQFIDGATKWDRALLKATAPVKRNDKGKPFFDFLDCSHAFDFNISHSGEYVCVAIGRVSVGVDIQVVQDNRTKLAKRFFSAEENVFLDGFEGQDELERFFFLWTRKEALLKADGCGITLDLRSFSTVENEIEFRGSIYTLLTLTEGVPRGYYISIAIGNF